MIWVYFHHVSDFSPFKEVTRMVSDDEAGSVIPLLFLLAHELCGVIGWVLRA